MLNSLSFLCKLAKSLHVDFKSWLLNLASVNMGVHVHQQAEQSTDWFCLCPLREENRRKWQSLLCVSPHADDTVGGPSNTGVSLFVFAYWNV